MGYFLSKRYVGGADLLWLVAWCPMLWFPCSVAPMMDWTDNHYRTLARLISRHAWLYTEMVVAETIVHQKDNLVSVLSCNFSRVYLSSLNMYIAYVSRYINAYGWS